MRPLRLGTRGSALALAQTAWVADRLAAVDPRLEIDVVPIRTSGDERAATEPFVAPAEDKSRFVREIEEALLDGEVDLAVHSAKDVPGTLPDGLSIVAVPERADARDALCGVTSLPDLPEGASVGTSSLRRRAQLLALRSDLEVEELRGNVDTRLGRLEQGDYAAIILATAGLARLGRDAGTPLAVHELTPAPGQGCLALEARADDPDVAATARRLTHEGSLVCLTAERAVVDALDASCRTPVGAHAVLGRDELELSAFAGMPDGSVWIRDAARGDADDPAALGRRVADRLLAAGAGELLAAAEAWALAGGAA